MKIFNIELKKMMFYQKGILIIAIFFLLSFLQLLLTDKPYNADYEKYKEQYETYLGKVEGKLTKEKANYIENEAKELSEAKEEKEQLYNDYYDGKIVEKDFKKQEAELSEQLKNQKGFEVIYSQYLYICQNKNNHYFLKNNGWNGLLAGEKFDFLLFITILILVTPIFCREYDTQMDILILTSNKGDRNRNDKIMLAVLVSLFVCIGKAVMDYVFYMTKYGLPHGGYPLQSLEYFGEGTKSISLYGAFMTVSLMKCFGCVLLIAELIFLSVIIKKYALTVFITAAGIILPYMGLSKSMVMSLPMPLSFLCATDFFRGNQFETDYLTNDKVAIFSEVSIGKMFFMIWGAVLFSIILIMIVLYVHRNHWNGRCHYRGRKNGKMVAMMMVLILVVPFCGCSNLKNGMKKVYYNTTTSDAYQKDDLKVLSSEEQKSPMCVYSNGRKETLMKDSLEGMNDEIQYREAIFGTGDFVYCIKQEKIIPIDKIGRFNSDIDKFSIMETNIKTFDEKVIFEKKINNGINVLGVEFDNNNQWSFLENCTEFFLNEKDIFFVCGNDVYRVSRKTEKIDILEFHTIGNIAFDGKYIYFMDDAYVLFRYDTEKDETEKLSDIVAYSFYLTDKGIYYVNRKDGYKVYKCDYEGQNIEKIFDKASIFIIGDTDGLICISKKNGEEYKVNFKELKKREIILN